MAKLRIYQVIDNSDYVITFVNDPKEIATFDKQLIEKFSEPEVNFGGSFDNQAGVSFTLPDEFIRIVSGLPFKKVVDANAAPWNTDTATKLTLYRTTMQTRFNDAFVALRAKDDSFTNEYVTTI